MDDCCKKKEVFFTIQFHIQIKFFFFMIQINILIPLPLLAFLLDVLGGLWGDFVLVDRKRGIVLRFTLDDEQTKYNDEHEHIAFKCG